MSIEENIGNKYLILVPTDDSKDKVKKCEEIWCKIKKHLIRSTNNNSGDYEEKYMKILLNSDDDLPLTKIVELHGMIIVVRSVFSDGNKYYPQVFLVNFTTN